MPLINVGPVAGIKAISVANVANPMSEATVPLTGELVTNAKVLITLKQCVISKVPDRTAKSPYKKPQQQQLRRASTSSNCKGGGKQFFKKKTPKKHPPKQKAYAVTFKPKTVLKETSLVARMLVMYQTRSFQERGRMKKVRITVFLLCNHSKNLAQSTNAKSKPSEGLYTDTEPDCRSEIITDVTIRVPGKPGTMMMEVKVDPGVQPSCIPLHIFKTLFPHLCRDGLPKPGLLDNTQSEFQSYNGGDMTCYGYLLIDVRDKVLKKYHPIRFYVMNTDVPRILISHAASYWLGLVKVLCDNKAPRIKRQVASIDKKSNFRVKDGPKMTSTQRLGSSSQKRESSSKTVTSGKVPVPSPRMHNFENAKIQGKSDGKGLRSGGDADVNDEEQHSQDEASASMGNGSKTSKHGNSVLSGPNKGIKVNIKDGHLRNAKLGPKMKQTSSKAPRRKYYMPSNDTQTFQINNKGHLQCQQDPNFIHRPNGKGKLPGSRDAPIYHEPGTVSCKMVEDLKKLYPNSFDRLGSLKGEYNIRVDPTVKPAMHARRKVPIESKEAIDRELDYLIEEEIITEQVEPTPWVSSVTFPMKPNEK